ncbi:MAG: hypothetical protein JWP09_449 [Candidatus Taylorbacteria bacterium]|nr:hypothetical protein [Candidatus Taylorbacteria bacterium]
MNNNNNNLAGVIIGAVIVIVAIGGVFWYQNEKVVNDTNANGGSLYVGITDATMDIKNVDEVNMEVKKVELHSATNGWVTASSDSKSYNLLALNAEGKTELYAKTKVVAGTYDRVRVTLGDTVVKTKSNGNVKAYSPSNQVVMNMKVNVKSEGDSQVSLDFLADKSLHVTSDNKYVFAPVVNAKSESGANVAVDNDSNAVESTGGSADSSVSVGVDIDGTSRSDFSLNTGADLKVDDSITGGVNFLLGGKTYKNNGADQESTNGSADANTNVNANGTTNTGTNGNTNSGVNANVNVNAGANAGTNSNSGSGALNVNGVLKAGY